MRAGFFLFTFLVLLPVFACRHIPAASPLPANRPLDERERKALFAFLVSRVRSIHVASRQTQKNLGLDWERDDLPELNAGFLAADTTRKLVVAITHFHGSLHNRLCHYVPPRALQSALGFGWQNRNRWQTSMLPVSELGRGGNELAEAVREGRPSMRPRCARFSAGEGQERDGFRTAGPRRSNHHACAIEDAAHARSKEPGSPIRSKRSFRGGRHAAGVLRRRDSLAARLAGCHRITLACELAVRLARRDLELRRQCTTHALPVMPEISDCSR